MYAFYLTVFDTSLSIAHVNKTVNHFCHICNTKWISVETTWPIIKYKYSWTFKLYCIFTYVKFNCQCVLSFMHHSHLVAMKNNCWRYILADHEGCVVTLVSMSFFKLARQEESSELLNCSSLQFTWGTCWKMNSPNVNLLAHKSILPDFCKIFT